jgi:hypothetical protein
MSGPAPKSPPPAMITERERLLRRCQAAASASFDARTWLAHIADCGVSVSVVRHDGGEWLAFDESQRLLDPESCDAFYVLMAQINLADQEERRRRNFALAFELERGGKRL